LFAQTILTQETGTVGASLRLDRAAATVQSNGFAAGSPLKSVVDARKASRTAGVDVLVRGAVGVRSHDDPWGSLGAADGSDRHVWSGVV
jgi:hypothetical protein